MEFVQELRDEKETIASLATPPGDGAIAAIRISGKEALDIGVKIFSRAQKKGKAFFTSHKAFLGKILDSDKNVIDEVILIPFLAPKSYTGEDSLEIFCHGGSLITNRVLEEVLKAGARQARPGEFTFRAFMNGKIDLSQAEAVQALIGAKNEKMVSAAKKLLEGRLSEKVRFFQEKLYDLAATLEAFLDFPEEGLEMLRQREIVQTLTFLRKEILHLSTTFYEGRLIHHGMKIAIVGAPNAGKSSLMNLLLQKARSIVSPKEGTTRDTIEESFRLFGLHLRLIDTAGIRKTEDEIEEEGVRRTFLAIDEADLILHVVDSRSPQFLFDKLPMEKTLLVWNKRDLVSDVPFHEAVLHQIAISCLHREGIDQFLAKMEKMIFEKGLSSKEELVITEIRHKEALDEAYLALNKVIDGFEHSLSFEYIALEVRETLYQLGKIIGANINEEILSAIFNKFCIGK